MNSTWRLVLLPPAVITWAVMLIRLGGELVGGPAWLFSREAGGGGAVVGISWLVVIFGAWFGWRLAKEGRGPKRPVMALLLHVAAQGVAVGGMLAAYHLQVVDFENPGPEIAYTFLAVLGTASLLMLWSWKELFMANLLYGFLARLGIILVTIPATLNSWDTHFNKAPKGHVDPTWAGALGVSTAQVCFWIPFTVLVGGLFGSIAGLIASGRRGASIQPDQAGAAGMVGGGDI
jgi:hypothetical protein